jgi:hypothetical protein
LVAVSYFSLLVMLSKDLLFIDSNHHAFITILYLCLMNFTFGWFSMFFLLIIGDNYYGIASSVLMVFGISTSTAIMDPLVMPKIAKIGSFFPFYYGVQGLKCLFFGSLCRDLNFSCGVLITWALIMSLVCIFIIHKRMNNQDYKNSALIQQ